MQIHITEGKSVGHFSAYDHVVRVFVDRDYHYGYWVPESLVLSKLSDDQKTQYLMRNDFKVDLSAQDAQDLIDAGDTHYTKARVVN